MKILPFSFILFIVFSISGCSSKNLEPKENEQKIEITQESNGEEFDDLLDEFSDELEIKDVYDPLNGYNRAMTTFNDVLFEYVLLPVSKGYKFILHKEIRKSVGKFFNNAFFPTRFANNLLQGKFYNALEEAERFILNSTVGILGLFDPAKYYFNIEAHKEDFGQTLGFYGVVSGPHIVLPFFGPSNVRDIFGMMPESFTNPLYYNDLRLHNITTNYAQYLELKVLENVNYNSLHIDEYSKLKEDAIDLYPYLRDVYEQYRDKQIKE